MNRILIIEDELIRFEVVRTKLELEGYEVFTARDGVEGSRLIQELRPDLIFLDALLPQKSGYEILEELQKGANKIPVIAISNSGEPAELERLTALGAKDYIIKTNFVPNDISDKARRFLGETPKTSALTSEAPFSEAVKKDGPAASRPVHILIVEDDKFLGDLISQKLSSAGFSVLLAIDGEEGLKMAEKGPLELILLDLLLPGIDGFKVLEKLKTNKQTASIPVVILSNLGQQEDIDRAMLLGAEDFMVKANFTPNAIVEKIKAVLSKKYL